MTSVPTIKLTHILVCKRVREEYTRDITQFRSFNLRFLTCRYNPMSNQWDRRKPMKAPRNRVGIGVIDNEMYAVGGSKGPEHQRTVERFVKVSLCIMCCAAAAVL